VVLICRFRRGVLRSLFCSVVARLLRVVSPEHRLPQERVQPPGRSDKSGQFCRAAELDSCEALSNIHHDDVSVGRVIQAVAGKVFTPRSERETKTLRPRQQGPSRLVAIRLYRKERLLQNNRQVGTDRASLASGSIHTNRKQLEVMIG
jgi:hypothetical protein